MSTGDQSVVGATCPRDGAILDDADRTTDNHVECPDCRNVWHPAEVYDQ